MQGWTAGGLALLALLSGATAASAMNPYEMGDLYEAAAACQIALAPDVMERMAAANAHVGQFVRRFRAGQGRFHEDFDPLSAEEKAIVCAWTEEAIRQKGYAASD